MKKETTQAVNGMEKLIAFVNYLESMGYIFEGISFQDAVSLQVDVERLISEKLTK